MSTNKTFKETKIPEFPSCCQEAMKKIPTVKNSTIFITFVTTSSEAFQVFWARPIKGGTSLSLTQVIITPKDWGVWYEGMLRSDNIFKRGVAQIAAGEFAMHSVKRQWVLEKFWTNIQLSCVG